MMPLSLLSDLMTSTQIPGMSVATVAEGKTSGHWALGIADTGKDFVVTDQTLFDAASLSKPVFAYLVLKLVTEGVLSLDQPLCELTDTPIGDNVDYSNLLTARMILSHQTGLPNWAKQNETPTFAFKPGTGYGYSGEAYVYLQKIIEARTGQSLETLAQEKVFGPLGMVHSHFSWPAEHESDIASPHDTAMVAQPPPIGRPENAAASLWTTALDYAKFVEAWFNDSNPALRALLDEAMTPHVWMTQDPKASDSLSEMVLSHVGWGMGWGLNKTNEGELIAFQYGDNGNAKGFVAINLSTRAAMVYFANSVNGLAIAQQAVASSVGNVDSAMQYLGYEAYGEHWAARHEALKKGQAAEAQGEYATAVLHFQQAVELYPNDKGTARRIQWLDELIHNQQTPFTPEKPLDFYVGHYGRIEMPIEITLEQGQLYLSVSYYKKKIRPVSDNYFAIDTDSRIRFHFDDQGNPNQLHSVFFDGGEDLSQRLHNPLMEEQADGTYRLTFVYRDTGEEAIRSLELLGAICDPSMRERGQLQRLPGTDVWQLTIDNIAADARITYQYLKNGRLIADPHNDFKIDSLYPVNGDQYIVELPRANKQLHVHREQLPALIDTLRSESRLLQKAIRPDEFSIRDMPDYHIHLPSHYDPNHKPPYKVLVHLDGAETIESMKMPAIMEMAMQDGTLEPTISIYIDATHRHIEYGCGTEAERYADFLAKEFMPRLQAEYPCMSRLAQDTTIAGFSMGGHGAVHIATSHPDVFGHVIGQSSSFWMGNETSENQGLLDKLRLQSFPNSEAARRLCVYLNVGDLETALFSGIGHDVANQHFVDFLQQQGIHCVFEQYSGDHCFAEWQERLVDGLIQQQTLHKVHLETLDKPAIRSIMRESEIPGMSVAVVDSKGNVSGMAMGMDPDATTLETLQFRPTTQAGVASLSKVVFAYLVLKLIEKHPELGFDLDTPLHTIVATDAEQFGHDVAKAHALTARLVLSHQTGLPIWADATKPIEFAFKPGKAYAYSGPSFVYLQKVIEQLTGSTLEELAQTLVFEPLHMHHSTFLDVDNVNDPTSSSRPKITCAANSLQTTANDYMRFVSAWLHDEALQHAFKSEVSMTKDAWAQETLSDENLAKVAWGLGWGLLTTAEGEVIGAFHHGDMSDRRAFVVLDLQTKTAGIVMSNGPNGHLLNQETLFTLFDVKEIATYFFGKFPFARTVAELKPDWRDKPSWGLRADAPEPLAKLLIDLPSLQTQLETENRLVDRTQHPYGSGAMVPYNSPGTPQLKVLVISPEPTVALRSRLDQMASMTPEITILSDEGLDPLSLSQQGYDLVLIDENVKQSTWQLNQQWLENTQGEKPLFYVLGEMEQVIDRETKALEFSGTVCVLKDDQVLVHQAFGARSTAASADANTTETKFSIGSIGKMFTAAATVKLATDKGLDFHQPIVDFLPENCPYKHLFHDFTLHELLTHTSGIKGGAQEFFFKESMLHFDQLQDHIPWLEACLDEAPASPHRGVHVYSNPGYFMLGLAIEAISGQAFFDYIQKNILQPAQMAHTTFRRETCDENLALPTVIKPIETTLVTPSFLTDLLDNNGHPLYKEANMAEQALHFIERYARSINIDGLLDTYQTALQPNGDLDAFKQSFSLTLADSYQKIAHHPDMMDRISKIGSALHDKFLHMKPTDPLYQKTKTLDDLLLSAYQYLNWQVQTLNSFANSLSIAHPAGCCYSTSQDLVAFHNALTQPEGALHACYEVMTAHKALFDKDQPLIGYGYGMTVDDTISCQGHNGGVPGGLSNYYTYPASGFTIVTLSNSDDHPIFPSLQNHLVLGEKHQIKYFSTQINPDVEHTFLKDLTDIQAKKTSPVETTTLNI